MNELFSQVSIEKPDIITPQKIFPRNSSEVIDVKRDYKIPYYEQKEKEKSLKDRYVHM